MSRATDTLSHRRAFLAGLCAAPVALAAPAAIASPGAHPDAELLRFGEEWREAQGRLDAAEGRPITDDELGALCNPTWNLEFKIQTTPALTLAGLALKAEIAARYVPEPDPDSQALDDMTGWLIADVLRLVGRPAQWEELLCAS